MFGLHLRTLVPVVTAAVLLLSFPSPHAARAMPTSVAVIACENLAAAIDGNTADATTAQDYANACALRLPPTGAASIQSLEQGIGDSDGALEVSELAPYDALDNNRIDSGCTYQAVYLNHTRDYAGCVLIVFALVDGENPVTLDLPAGLASIESQGAADAICQFEPSGGTPLVDDEDCTNTIPANGDGIVVFRILNDTATDGQTLTVHIQQEAVEQADDIHVSNETRNSANPDLDGDGVATVADNCPYAPNSAQTNTDDAPLTTPGVVPIDTSIPNGDALGDACDPDMDNDGRDNDQEINGDDPSPPGGCLAQTDPLLRDSDGDRVTDAAECRMGSDPANPASLPVIGADADHDGLGDFFEATIGSSPNAFDTDGDGISDGIEFKGYNTSPLIVDTDGDGCTDGQEIASVDSYSAVNSLDLKLVASSFALPLRPAIDINKDGQINSLDLQLVARQFAPSACDVD